MCKIPISAHLSNQFAKMTTTTMSCTINVVCACVCYAQAHAQCCVYVHTSTVNVCFEGDRCSLMGNSLLAKGPPLQQSDDVTPVA